MLSWMERSATRRALNKLEEAVGVLLTKVAPPVLSGPKERAWFQFPDHGPVQLILVKAARAVSGLNAVPCLLESSYHVEAAVILRTVDDFLDEITFVVDSTQGPKPTTAQKDFIDHFFAETVPEPAARLVDSPQPNRAKRKDIRAAQARLLSTDDPDTFRRNLMAVDQGWDGYVHGAYPHSMELYVGTTRGGHFDMSGTEHGEYVESLWFHYAHYISRAFSVLALVAHLVGLPGLRDDLITERKRFEAAPEFPSDA